MVKVKICGLTDPDLVRFCASEGASWIGLNFVPGSPRRVTLAAAASLLLHVGEAVPVGLVADASDAEIDAIVALGFPVLQLHGAESPGRVAAIAARTGREVWKAWPIGSLADLKAAAEDRACDRLLLDARPPGGAGVSGGHGATFDWSLLSGWAAPKPWILAGGLTPDNVAAAIAATGAAAVDVASGVERVRGLKDRGLVRAFLRAAEDV